MQADRRDGRSGKLNRVAFTVPEGGYDLNPATLGFYADLVDILRDVASPGTLRTAFGTNEVATRPRRDRGFGPFTGRSGGDLWGDGASPRRTVVSPERLTDPGIAVWITANRSFPDSMVDFIVPTTGAKEPSFACQLRIDAAAQVAKENSAGVLCGTIPEQDAPIWAGSGAKFANPWIVDMIRRVVCDGSPRHPNIVPEFKRNAVNAGRLVGGLALAEALWARTCAGTREDGTVIGPHDPKSDIFVKTAVRAGETSPVWPGQRRFFGNLADHPDFRAGFALWPQMTWSDGTGAAMSAYFCG